MILVRQTREDVHRFAVLIACVAVVSCHGASPPPRPNGVPAEAVWAGGADGGTWIRCAYRTQEPHVGYDCELYNDWSGNLEASGRFVLAYLTSDGPEFPADPFSGGAPTEYQWYNGEEIRISERRTPYPDGWIDFPFGDGHGKRVRYSLGVEEEWQSY